ncbi:MAG: hypothetical protein ACXVID_04150, partial [Thermoanaerobaculia bacterium]
LAELFQVPVVLTEQNPQGLGGTHPDVRSAFDGLTVAKRTLAKTSFSWCANPGFAGVDNVLYYLDRTLMLFGDAKAFVGDLVKEVEAQSGERSA